MIKNGRPLYEDDRRIEMTAYMGPRRAGKRFFNGTYGNPRDPEEGYDFRGAGKHRRELVFFR